MISLRRVQRIRRSRNATRASCGMVLSVMLVWGTAAFAQSENHPASAGTLELKKGDVEVGVIGGTSLPVSWLRAHADRRLTMASVAIGRVVSQSKGPGVLAGNFEFLVEITPLVAVQQPDWTAGLAASPLHMRWNFSAGARARIFAEASGGVIYTNHAVPIRAATSFNFIDQAGFGVRIAGRARRQWLAGYRFQHISNAGRAEPNPGANFNFVYVGVTFLRR